MSQCDQHLWGGKGPCPDCVAEQYVMPEDQWRAFFEKHRDDALMVHDWPECGPGAIKVEELYQAIKARLLHEFTGGKDDG